MSTNIDLKEANISVHVIATGAGAGLQQFLWATPGCSAYLSGASFPYATEETEEILGFRPKSFCSEDAAIDLASTAYMKAFHIGKKSPVGIGITATVASETAHRGDNRFHICVMTDNKVRLLSQVLVKGIGAQARETDGMIVDNAAYMLLLDAVLNDSDAWATDVAARASDRFMQRPFFTSDSKRLEALPEGEWAIMPGSFNPPHEGHLGIAAQSTSLGKNVVFEIGANPPHKAVLTVQDMLRRAKMLKGHNVLFTNHVSLFLDKAKAFPGSTLMIGADTLIRLFDPKWGVDTGKLLQTFSTNGIKFAVFGRVIDETFVSGWSAVVQVLGKEFYSFSKMFVEMPGRWDISSTELRSKSNE